jgi:putative oxidoreductase
MPGSNQSSSASFGLLLMRVGASALLLFGHGWGKLVHFSEKSATFADPLHIGHSRSLALTVFAEVICAILVGLGFATRFAAAVLVIQFAVIVLVVMHGAPFGDRELALIYAMPFLCLMFTGGGAYALDTRFGPKLKFGGGK